MYEQDKWTITQAFTKADEERYVKIPLSFSKECWQVELHMTAPDNCVIDLGLEEQSGKLIGWSGSEHKSIRISELVATPAYLKCSPKQASWNLILGLYKLNEDTKIEITVVEYLDKRRWLVGESHSHSVHSDGNLTVSEVKAVAKSAGLDYLFMTDHNTVSAWPEVDLYSDEALTMLKGMELTWYGGHSNVYGLDEPLNHYIKDKEDVKRVFEGVKAKGGFISINHPFLPTVGWTYGLDDLPFDMIEIWNGPWHEANQKALEYWHQLLVSGRKILMTGGSDTHRPELFRSFGYPALAVLADNPTGPAIVEAMVKGRSNVLMMPKYPLINLDISGYGLGEVVPVTSKADYIQIHAERLNPDTDVLELYTEQGLWQTVEVKGITMTEAFSLNQRPRFIYALLKRSLPMLGSLPGTITNPIFLAD